ncbi:MAG: hypothetical protein AVDCRST_MAG30-2541, partial [uncultured Solirubrobacteraceae bacterium]
AAPRRPLARAPDRRGGRGHPRRGDPPPAPALAPPLQRGRRGRRADLRRALPRLLHGGAGGRDRRAGAPFAAPDDPRDHRRDRGGRRRLQPLRRDDPAQAAPPAPGARGDSEPAALRPRIRRDRARRPHLRAAPAPRRAAAARSGM